MSGLLVNSWLVGGERERAESTADCANQYLALLGVGSGIMDLKGCHGHPRVVTQGLMSTLSTQVQEF